MSKTLLMGNNAIGMGAIAAGVKVVSGYPGTPSTEVLETVAKNNDGHIYVEWSVNEKAALEVAAGAAYTGNRSMVTMKQVGLNVASDPLMSLAYIGIKGGMVVMVADDPGPISSQTEQDTRQFAIYSKLPIFDPSSPDEAYDMIQDAFDYSEKYKTPVIFRPTTRVCHGCSTVNVVDTVKQIDAAGFEKAPNWVIFPKLSYNNHIMIEKRNVVIGKDFSEYKYNSCIGTGKKAIITQGISYKYTQEALSLLNVSTDDYKLIRIATPHPFPADMVESALKDVDSIIAIEELDPVLEKEVLLLSARRHININVYGKLTEDVNAAGENTVESVRKVLAKYLEIEDNSFAIDSSSMPSLPMRPPVLCAGCPHRASFYAVKQALKGKKAVFSGDIGCYTLGNAAPLDMVDTCLCMGAGVTIAQGMHRAEPDAVNIGFLGDSTFFAAGMTGAVNAFYNQTDIVYIVLDNSTTAMTGHQPHPGTGITMMGEVATKVSIENILKGIGIEFVETVNPFDQKRSIEIVKKAVEYKGVSVVIFKSPCIAVTKPNTVYKISDSCINCMKCIREIGCPAIIITDGKVKIDETLCFGCGLCSSICPKSAFVKAE